MGWFGKTVTAVVIVVLAFFLTTRFTDGPIGVVTGGPFNTGQVVSDEPDWRFVKDYEIVEFQLLEPCLLYTSDAADD